MRVETQCIGSHSLGGNSATDLAAKKQMIASGRFPDNGSKSNEQNYNVILI